MPLCRPSTPEDCLSLAPRLRKEDVAEIKAVNGNDPLPELQQALRVSDECWTIEHRDEQSSEGLVIGMFGVAPLEGAPGVGAIWLLASDDLPKIRWSFLKRTRPWIEHFLSKYPILTNWVDSRNEVHIKWLKWAGFQFTSVTEQFSGEPFHQFVKQRSHSCAPMPLPV